MSTDDQKKTLEAQYAQCLRAFHQDPTPRLAVALKQLAAAIKNLRRN